jgi:hypothetical protein
LSFEHRNWQIPKDCSTNKLEEDHQGRYPFRKKGTAVEIIAVGRKGITDSLNLQFEEKLWGSR